MVNGRHNLDARSVETILNIRVQVGIGDEHGVRIPRVGVDFILHVGILQLLLQDERRRIRQNVGSLAGSFDQQPVNGSPGRVIANSHGRVQDYTLRLSQQAVVDDMAAEHHRVGNDNLFLLERQQMSGQHVLRDDFA